MHFRYRLGIACFFLLALSIVALAQSPALTNSEIIKMVRAELSEAVVLTAIDSARTVDFDVSPAGLIDLKNAGVPEAIIQAMQAKARSQTATASGDTASPERSERLADSKDPQEILHRFKTLYVDASKASFFGNEQMKAELRKAKGFDALGVTIVDDPGLADVVLHVGYTFAWDYPFSLTHQNTTVVLLSGKGSGPFSGPAGAKSVAQEFTKLLKAYRTPATPGGTKAKAPSW
ncbi:MAG TPA: hypothetical protein VK886_05095 [Vicinamibacterales bacterium]|nr:hypothetical protein [Vicinamibacterales bacterium]